MKDSADTSAQPGSSLWIVAGLIGACVGVLLGVAGYALLAGPLGASASDPSRTAQNPTATDPSADVTTDPETGLTAEEMAGALEIQWRLELAEAREALKQKDRKIDELEAHLSRGAASGLLWGAETVATEPGAFFPMRIEWLPQLNLNPQMFRQSGQGGARWATLSESDRALVLIEQLFLLQPEETQAVKDALAATRRKIQELEIEKMQVVDQKDTRVIIKVASFIDEGKILRDELHAAIVDAIGESRFRFVWPTLEASLQEDYARFGAMSREIIIQNSGRSHARYRIDEMKNFLGRGTARSTRYQDTIPEQYAHLFEPDPSAAIP
ncbi:MAG: hypothetical protein ACFBZ8_07930 [Opitutales bacterium]